MRPPKALIVLALLPSRNVLKPQEGQQQRFRRENEEKSMIQEVEQVNRASEEINEISSNTTEAIKGTISNTTKTLKETG